MSLSQFLQRPMVWSDPDGSLYVSLANWGGFNEVYWPGALIEPANPGFRSISGGTRSGFCLNYIGNNCGYQASADWSGWELVFDAAPYGALKSIHVAGGKAVAVVLNSNGQYAIYTCNVDGSNIQFRNYGTQASMSYDGTFFIFTGFSSIPGTTYGYQIYQQLVTADGSVNCHIMTFAKFGDPTQPECFSPTLSPDGARLAYISGIVTGSNANDPSTWGARNLWKTSKGQGIGNGTQQTNFTVGTISSYNAAYAPSFGTDCDTVGYGVATQSGFYLAAMDDTGSFSQIFTGIAATDVLSPNRHL